MRWCAGSARRRRGPGWWAVEDRCWSPRSRRRAARPGGAWEGRGCMAGIRGGPRDAGRTCDGTGGRVTGTEVREFGIAGSCRRGGLTGWVEGALGRGIGKAMVRSCGTEPAGAITSTCVAFCQNCVPWQLEVRNRDTFTIVSATTWLSCGPRWTRKGTYCAQVRTLARYAICSLR